ncbi:translation initiation factor IF-2-like [Lemur catta]|uniref:translation initiation factor IF-2-like n=1 Tax=Lemur catta TaxID=9447 RepID=UPI001E26CE0D|nr:translation initiation factor IF-2-like [Lemur catta]
MRGAWFPPPGENLRRVKYSATRPPTTRLLRAFQDGPSPPPHPSPRPRPLRARPGALLGPLTHDEPPLRPRRSSETGPGLSSDSCSGPGAATSVRRGLRLRPRGCCLASPVCQQLPRRPPGGGGPGAAATARRNGGLGVCVAAFDPRSSRAGCKYCGHKQRKKIQGPESSPDAAFLDRKGF